MNRYSISSYAQALDRIRSNGFVWDVGQIAPSVIKQLDWSVARGEMIRTIDGWPLRTEGGERRPLYQLTEWGLRQLD